MSNDLSASIYDGMEAPARAIAQEAAAHISSIQKKLSANIVDIGNALLRVKGAVGHGQFLPWLKAEFNWTERTAQNFMSVAERLGDKYETVSHLPLKTVYALASPSTPDDLRNGVVAKLEKGEPVEPTEIASELREVRREAQRKVEAKKKLERSFKGKSQAECERALAAFGRREKAREAEQNRVRKEVERRDQARAEAATLVVKSLSSQDLAWLLQLMGDGFLRADQLVKAASALSGGVKPGPSDKVETSADNLAGRVAEEVEAAVRVVSNISIRHFGGVCLLPPNRSDTAHPVEQTLAMIAELADEATSDEMATLNRARRILEAVSLRDQPEQG